MKGQKYIKPYCKVVVGTNQETFKIWNEDGCGMDGKLEFWGLPMDME